MKETDEKDETIKRLRQEQKRKNDAEKEKRKAAQKDKDKKREKENEKLWETAKVNRLKLWSGFFIILSAVTIGLFILLDYFWLITMASLLISVLFWLVVTLGTLILAYVETPFMNVDMVECFGKYVGRPMKPGPHFFFPYFYFENIMTRVFMGEQRLEFHLDEDEEGQGDVEFQDCSASLDASFYFRVTDPERAVYDVDDLFGSIKKRAEHLLRAFFGIYSLDDAIKLKNFFRIQNVASYIDVSSDIPNEKISPEELKNIIVTEEEANETNFYIVLSSWGVEPLNFTISDIEIPEEIRNQRSRILTAEKDKEVAKIDGFTAKLKKAIKVTEAQAESLRISKEGEGEAKKIKKIMDLTSLGAEDVASYLVSTTKWNSLGKNAQITLIEDSNNTDTSKGVKMGIGMGIGSKKKDEPKKS